MLRKTAKLFLRGLLFVILAGVLVVGLPRLIVENSARSLTYTVEDVAPARVAIVFGAGLMANGSPSPVLRDRVETAARLYQAGKVEKLLMSGDNRFVDYNEPGAMHDYAVGLGVPDQDIVLDYAGRRTYDTCYRARYIFQVDQAILVTQSFHLPRALITCNQMGLSSTGVAAANRRYLRRYYVIWYMRELPATTAALWDLWVAHPLPVLGKPEPIFTQSQQAPAPTPAQPPAGQE